MRPPTVVQVEPVGSSLSKHDNLIITVYNSYGIMEYGNIAMQINYVQMVHYNSLRLQDTTRRFQRGLQSEITQFDTFLLLFCFC
jgi:hypothetical protein